MKTRLLAELYRRHKYLDIHIVGNENQYNFGNFRARIYMVKLLNPFSHQINIVTSYLIPKSFIFLMNHRSFMTKLVKTNEKGEKMVLFGMYHCSFMRKLVKTNKKGKKTVLPRCLINSIISIQLKILGRE